MQCGQLDQRGRSGRRTRTEPRCDRGPRLDLVLLAGSSPDRSREVDVSSPNAILEEFRDLLDRPIVAALATTGPDGQPQVTPVWCGYDGDHVIINATADRQKHHNMVARPAVTLLLVDPDNQFRYLEIRGVVEEITAEGGGKSMDELSLLYTGRHKRYGIEAPRREDQERLLYKISPRRVSINPLTRPPQASS